MKMSAQMTCVGKREFLGDQFFTMPDDTVMAEDVHLVEVNFLTDPAGVENGVNDKLVMTMGPEQADHFELGGEYMVGVKEMKDLSVPR